MNYLSPSFGHDPSFPMVRKCLGGLRCGRVFRVKICLPRLRSAPPSTHYHPSGLRCRGIELSPNRTSSKVFHQIGAVPLAQLRTPLPPSRSYFTPWLQPPMPPPVARHQALSSSLPALPHSYRRLCSLVIPAGSLDPRALRRQEQLSFVFPKSNFVS